eukprot:scaffold3576_cov170-Amphora_coffeaeformis.AAC.7
MGRFRKESGIIFVKTVLNSAIKIPCRDHAICSSSKTREDAAFFVTDIHTPTYWNIMQCELSGESLPHTAAVVTPSGHICRKDLLLTKLTENGGVDPFHPDRPLQEDSLIALAAPQSSPIPPRPLQASSFPSLMTAVQQEYDAVVLELFDTRQALADARQELSQALYQNDAAARVIARLVAERDAARQKLQDWDATGASESSSNNKKRKLSAVPQEIPAADLQLLQESKVVASFPVGQAEVTTLDLSDEWIAWGTASGDVEFAKPKAGAKTQSVNVEAPVVNVSLHFGHQHAFVATKTGKVYLVHLANATIVSVFSGPAAYTTGCLHPDGLIYVAGTQQGALHVWDIKTQSLAATLDEPGSASVESVQVSPNGYHIGAAYADGAVRVWDLRKSKVLATLPTNGNVATIVAFDQAGKFILYGAGGTITAVPVKEWGKKLELSTAGNDVSFVTWSSKSGIVGADDKGVTCYGAP